MKKIFILAAILLFLISCSVDRERPCYIVDEITSTNIGTNGKKYGTLLAHNSDTNQQLSFAWFDMEPKVGQCLN